MVTVASMELRSPGFAPAFLGLGLAGLLLAGAGEGALAG
jgi:hypothetical protein